MKFVDEATIKVQAGNGGRGMVSFRREKFIPFGGPDGGDGGAGGSIHIVADAELNTLADFRYQRTFKAKNGEPGGSADCSGRGGEDLEIVVPVGTVIYDVKSTRNLKPWITRHGGTPLLWKTGHSLVKAKMKETGAALAGEMSGHTFFKERWYGFDDGLYAGARLLEILSRHADPGAVLDALPDSLSTPELNVACAEGEHHALIARLATDAQFPGATDVIRIDGLRVEYPDGFGLARGSNTTPVIVLRFEADNAAALARIQGEFRRVLTTAKPGIALPF